MEQNQKKLKNLPNNICELCHEYCETCTGPTEFECPICKEGPYFAYENQENACGKCDDRCSSCFDETEYDCTACVHPNYLTVD